MAMKIRRLFGDPLPKLQEHQIRLAFLLLTIITVGIILLTAILQIRTLFYYSLISLAGMLIFYRARKRIHLQWETVVLVLILVILNFLGNMQFGNLYFLGVRYDQFMHFAGCAIVALAIYDFITPYLKTIELRYQFGIIVLITLGVAALIEICEFAALIMFGENVGDYFNTLGDLISGLLGAVVGTVLVDFWVKKKGAKHVKL